MCYRLHHRVMSRPGLRVRRCARPLLIVATDGLRDRSVAAHVDHARGLRPPVRSGGPLSLSGRAPQGVAIPTARPGLACGPVSNPALRVVDGTSRVNHRPGPRSPGRPPPPPGHPADLQSCHSSSPLLASPGNISSTTSATYLGWQCLTGRNAPGEPEALREGVARGRVFDKSLPLWPIGSTGKMRRGHS